MARAKDARQMSVYGYSRLVGYHPKTFELEADILESFEVKEGRRFTFELRRGHSGRMVNPLPQRILDIGGRMSLIIKSYPRLVPQK